MIDQFTEYEDQLEDEDDFAVDWNLNLQDSVMSGSDWTTETIITQIDKGNINLNPVFQRRSAWTDKRKSKFIESIIMGFPIPQIVLAQTRQQRGKFVVLDGKQRLLALKCFTETNDDSEYRRFKLRGLEVRKDLNGLYWSDLSNDAKFAEDMANFENHTIRTIVIKNWPNEDFLYHVFLRLNTGSVQLSPQELRQALHPGDFTNFLTVYSESMPSLRKIFKNQEPDFRMRDVELLIRFIGFKYFIADYRGNLKSFLDSVCQRLNAAWQSERVNIEADLREFEITHDYFVSAFGDGAYSKFTAHGYEKKFNRAIFDVLYFYFIRTDVRTRIPPAELKALFEALCLSDQEFVRAIEQTTKSISSTSIRFGKFGQTLNMNYPGLVVLPVIS